MSTGRAAPEGNQLVKVGSPGGPIEVPVLWLRDNCPCQQCRIAATTEHRFMVTSVDPDLRPLQVSISGADTAVDWGDHQSYYSAQWWEDVQAQYRRHHPRPRRWVDGEVPVRFDYEAIRGNDPKAEADFLTAFGELGAVVVTNTPTTSGSCVDFIRRWAPPLEVPFDLVHNVYVDPDGYNVAHTAEALPPHTDMASKASPPSGQILHMLINEARGGDSVLVDGLAVIDQLDEADLKILEAVPVEFRQFSATAETWCRAPVLLRNADGTLRQIRFSNQLLQTVDPSSELTAAWYSAYHRLASLVMDESNQVSFRLESGQLMMVNNHRVLHARRAFEPSSGRRHLQDVYFDADDVVNEAWRKANQP